MKDKKVYIAGSLFNEAEVDKRLKEEKQLREIGFSNIFNPISSPQNDKKRLPSSAEIFWGDTEKILDSDVVVADISNSVDLGVACELGIVWSCNYINELATNGFNLEQILKIMKKKELITHLSDIRKGTSNQYKNNYIPWGFNQFEIGMIEDIGVIRDNFKEVLDELKRGV